MKTYTPDLGPAVLDRLRDYAALFAPDFPQAKPARWAGVYLQGLLLDGERKRIEPLARRVTLPDGLVSKDPEQALQQFVSQGPWDEQKVLRRYRAHLARTFASPDGVFVIDDTTFPKQGADSVGVQRQYCGAKGKKANCQAAVSVHYVGPRGHYPLALRLFLPDAWLADRRRLDRAGVPPSTASRGPRGGSPWACWARSGPRGSPAGWWSRTPATASRGRSGRRWPSGLDVPRRGDRRAGRLPGRPRWDPPAGRTGVGGRPQTNAQLAAGSPPPVRLRDLAAGTPVRRRTWREGTKGKLAGRFAWLRVWPGYGWRRGECAGADPVWVLIEEQADGAVKYAVSNLPAGTTCLRAVRLWKSRWAVEQGYQQMKEELGLDHFEGRGWRGFHHHACLVLLAYGFLLLERHRAQQARRRRGKKGAPSRG